MSLGQRSFIEMVSSYTHVYTMQAYTQPYISNEQAPRFYFDYARGIFHPIDNANYIGAEKKP
jgi:hypothetical protein